LDQEVLERFQDKFDLVVGGHSHVLTPYNGRPPSSSEFGEVIEAVPSYNLQKLVHTGANGAHVGWIQMEWNRSTISRSTTLTTPNIQSQVLRLESIVSPDPTWRLPTAEESSSSNASSNTTIIVSMQGSQICAQECRTGDCLLGHLVTDAMRSCALDGPCKSSISRGTDTPRPVIALLESGTLRNCLLPGKSDSFQQVLPWPNQLIAMQISGYTLNRMIQHGLQTVGGGGLLQISGIHYQYHTSRINKNKTLAGTFLSQVPLAQTQKRRKSRRRKLLPKLQFLEDTFPTRSCQVGGNGDGGNEGQPKELKDNPIIVDIDLYWVIVTDWLAMGGDGYLPYVKEAKQVIGTNVTLERAIMSYATTRPLPYYPSPRRMAPVKSFSSATKSGIAGFVGGAVAFLGTFPVYTLFVRKSMSKSVSCSQRLCDGVWLGTLATALSDAIYFFVFACIGGSALVRSSIAAFTNSVATTPLWVIVTHQQLAAKSRPIFSVAYSIYKDKGWSGFFDSLSMNLLMCIYPVIRHVTLDSILWAFYDSKLSSSTHVATAAAMASLVATIVTYPIQKWRIKLQSGERTTGKKKFCNGLGFKLLDTCLKTFLLFLVKEQSDVMLCILEG